MTYHYFSVITFIALQNILGCSSAQKKLQKYELSVYNASLMNNVNAYIHGVNWNMFQLYAKKYVWKYLTSTFFLIILMSFGHLLDLGVLFCQKILSHLAFPGKL